MLLVKSLEKLENSRLQLFEHIEIITSIALWTPKIVASRNRARLEIIGLQDNCLSLDRRAGCWFKGLIHEKPRKK